MQLLLKRVSWQRLRKLSRTRAVCRPPLSTRTRTSHHRRLPPKPARFHSLLARQRLRCISRMEVCQSLAGYCAAVSCPTMCMLHASCHGSKVPSRAANCRTLFWDILFNALLQFTSSAVAQFPPWAATHSQQTIAISTATALTTMVPMPACCLLLCRRRCHYH